MKKIKVQNNVYGMQPFVLKNILKGKICDFIFIKYLRYNPQDTGNGVCLWNRELNRWVFQLSITESWTTSKLNGIKPHPFYQTHRFCGSGIWPGPGGGSMTYLCSLVSDAPLWRTDWEYVTQMAGAGNIWRLLHSPAWHLPCMTQLALLTSVPASDHSMWLGVPHSMAASEYSDLLCGNSGLQEQGFQQTRQVLWGLMTSLRNHIASLPLSSVGWRTHKPAQMQGTEK